VRAALAFCVLGFVEQFKQIVVDSGRGFLHGGEGSGHGRQPGSGSLVGQEPQA
jgi:hypothetical protein